MKLKNFAQSGSIVTKVKRSPFMLDPYDTTQYSEHLYAISKRLLPPATKIRRARLDPARIVSSLTL